MVGTVIEVKRVGERRLAAHELDFSSFGGVVGGARWSECRLLGVGCVHIQAGSFVLLCTTKSRACANKNKRRCRSQV